MGVVVWLSHNNKPVAKALHEELFFVPHLARMSISGMMVQNVNGQGWGLVVV